MISRRSPARLSRRLLLPLAAASMLCLGRGEALANPLAEAEAAYARGDMATAVGLLQPLAEQGNVDAQFNLAVMYLRQRRPPTAIVEAAKWFRRAADQGNPEAQTNLGHLYKSGHGVAKDLGLAASWYLRAAKQGERSGQYNIGLMHARGEGVRQDFVQAHLWYALAAERGYPRARESRDFIANGMTPTQIAEARQLAAAFRPVMERPSR